MRGSTRPLTGTDQGAVLDLVEQCREAHGVPPLNDHLAIDLTHGHVLDRPDRAVGVVLDVDGHLAGYAQASRVGSGWVAGTVLDPASDDESASEHLTDLLTPLVEHVAQSGGGHVNWWVVSPTAHHDRAAVALGLQPGRELLQLFVGLPLDQHATVSTRSFVVGVDDERWLKVNNRAFAWHDEQGGWDLSTLRARQAEAWFDPDGFRLHERDGRLAAFCWTKIHDDGPEPVGEIYAIGVDPDLHGLGLGRQLTLAGLDDIAARGVRRGMLYVDAHNKAAVGLYLSLGFEAVRTDRAYTADVAPHRHDDTGTRRTP